MSEQGSGKQLLHLMTGGELRDLGSAQMRYCIVQLHRLLDPERAGTPAR